MTAGGRPVAPGSAAVPVRDGRGERIATTAGERPVGPESAAVPVRGDRGERVATTAGERPVGPESAAVPVRGGRVGRVAMTAGKRPVAMIVGGRPVAPGPAGGPSPDRPRTARRLALGVSLVLAAVAGMGGCLAPTQTRESAWETLREADAAALSVELERGSVAVVGHAGGEVEIEVERTAHGWSPEAAQSSLAALMVEVRRDEETGRVRVTGRSANAGLFRPGESHSVRLEIRAPAGIPVEVRTADGRIELTGLRGPVLATTADGRITASALGPVRNGAGGPAGDGAGDPAANAPTIHLRSGNGRITGEDLRGAVVAETGDGRITLGGRLSEVTAVTGSGSVRVDATDAGAAPTGVWRLHTADGEVRLELPESVNAELSVVAPRLRGRERDDLEWERRGVARVARAGDAEADSALILIRADEQARVYLGPRP